MQFRSLWPISRFCLIRSLNLSESDSTYNTFYLLTDSDNLVLFFFTMFYANARLPWSLRLLCPILFLNFHLPRAVYPSLLCSVLTLYLTDSPYCFDFPFFTSVAHTTSSQLLTFGVSLDFSPCVSESLSWMTVFPLYSFMKKIYTVDVNKASLL